MNRTIDQIDYVLDRHPAAGFHTLKGGSQFYAILGPYANCGPVALAQVTPQYGRPFTLRQNGRFFKEVHFGQFRLGPKLLLVVTCRWMVKSLFQPRNFATTLDGKQAISIIKISVPARVRPPAIAQVESPSGETRRLPGCTLSRPRDILCRSAPLFRVPRHRFFQNVPRPCAAISIEVEDDHRA